MDDVYLPLGVLLVLLMVGMLSLILRMPHTKPSRMLHRIGHLHTVPLCCDKSNLYIQPTVQVLSATASSVSSLMTT